MYQQEKHHGPVRKLPNRKYSFAFLFAVLEGQASPSKGLYFLCGESRFRPLEAFGGGQVTPRPRLHGLGIKNTRKEGERRRRHLDPPTPVLSAVWAIYKMGVGLANTRTDGGVGNVKWRSKVCGHHTYEKAQRETKGISQFIFIQTKIVYIDIREKALPDEGRVVCQEPPPVLLRM